MKTILCTLLGFNFIKNVQKFPQTLRSWDFYLQKQPFTTHSTMSTRDKLLWKWFNSQMHRHGPKSYQMAVNCIVVTDLLSFVYTKSISPAMLLFLLHFYSASTLEQFFSVLFWLHLSLFDQCFGEGYKKRQQGKKKQDDKSQHVVHMKKTVHIQKLLQETTEHISLSWPIRESCKTFRNHEHNYSFSQLNPARLSAHVWVRKYQAHSHCCLSFLQQGY